MLSAPIRFRLMSAGCWMMAPPNYTPMLTIRLGHLTNSVDPLGRTFSYLYDTNGIDLLEVRQTRAGNNELLAKATYNSQHQPLTTQVAPALRSKKPGRWFFNAVEKEIKQHNNIGIIAIDNPVR